MRSAMRERVRAGRRLALAMAIAGVVGVGLAGPAAACDPPDPNEGGTAWADTDGNGGSSHNQSPCGPYGILRHHLSDSDLRSRQLAKCETCRLVRLP